jgi:hypothetical protein
MTIFDTVALFPMTTMAMEMAMVVPTHSRLQPVRRVPPPPTRGSPTPSTASTDTGAGGAAKRQRSLTSDVWHYLDVLSTDIGGKLIRYGARCKFCKKELPGKSTVEVVL